MVSTTTGQLCRVPIPEPDGYQYTLGCFQDQPCLDPQPSTVVTIRGGHYVRWVVAEDQNSFGNNTGDGEDVLDVVRLS